MERNQEYKEKLGAYLGITPDDHTDKIFDCGKMYLEHHFKANPLTVQKWITTHAFWTWFQTQWNMKCRETYEILTRANISPNRAARLFGSKNYEILAMFPSQPIVDNIYNELEENVIQELLNGTGVRLRKEPNYITKNQ